MVLAVPILPAKNPPPPRHLAPLPHAFSPAFVLPHALAGGLVLLLEMLVLGVEPTGAELCLPVGFFFLGAADALLGGPWGLAAAVVAGRSPALGIRCGRGEEGEGEKGEEWAHYLSSE